MDVDGRIHRGEDAPMPSGMKTDNRRIHVFQIEGRLNFLVLLHAVRRIADAIEHMEFNQRLAPTQHEREGRLRIEAGRFRGARDERFQIREGTNVSRDRQVAPSRYFGPDQERRPAIITLGDLDNPCGIHPRK